MTQRGLTLPRSVPAIHLPSNPICIHLWSSVFICGSSSLQLCGVSAPSGGLLAASSNFFMYFLNSTWQRSEASAPLLSQCLIRAGTSVTRPSLSFFIGSYVPSSSSTRPSRGWRWSMATIRKYGRCFRPSFFMRMRTATESPLLFTFSVRRPASGTGARCGPANAKRKRLHPSAFVLLALLLAFLRPCLPARSAPGADLCLGHHGPGIEHPRLAHAHQRLEAVEHAHVSDLPHDRPHLIELPDKLLDFVRLRPASLGDPAAAAQVDDVRIPLLLLGHRVDHPLDPLDCGVGGLVLGNHLAHAGHLADQLLHAAHLGHGLELLAEVVEREIALGGLLLPPFDFLGRQVGLRSEERRVGKEC